ncbi:FtsK/SpoIIIE family DNA translocase [Ferruginibacter albus]|uniref:FtsK/SpoIIIE family DNA translocase n=1 Tax=Ferruginibacter albus TaxID=2875540 RepID=UPI001CC631FE|nr:DNA translocase FtsK 4TM domain-containing protein [Ferruginibacter albus]UAY52925.1 DNA translocase FtsK 4TM domain-containing protein [Ferruginibacter albus]
MATKKKTTKPKAAEADALQTETVEKVEVKKLLKDERTHKIAGAICMLVAFLLFVAFTSYLFTWDEDQDKVINQGIHLLLVNDIKVNNQLGTFGAFLSDFFIRKGFGIASFLICTFFFTLSINLFFGRKVFSIARNIKYVLIGLVVLSVGFAVVFNGKLFPWGGEVGNMSRDWLFNILGEVGTFAILIVAVLSYIIWRFNPAFNFTAKKNVQPINAAVAEEAAVAVDEITPEENAISEEVKGNFLKGNAGMMNPLGDTRPAFNDDIKIIEKEEEPVAVKEEEKPIESKEIPLAIEPAVVKPVPVVKAKEEAPASPLELEIKTVPDKVEEEVPVMSAVQKVAASKPYDPVLDLRDYKYPTLDLLENHGSEKIVQDPNELENNKNQIISTLRNYDIEIQKIAATVGPTVTLYEIIPVAGVRISRIKNLEDDIALSLAALGIRIIAPIPGKGTIGIEVPNAKKTIVSMKTLLASDKFQNNNFALPIAIGKKIDNENFIVDLASMPHLLMAGATGQGKSVGLNAILVSLLYKKHPSQLKFVLVDPKKVELSIYRAIENHFLAKLPGEEDAIITDTKKVINTLNALCIEMDNRYDLLKEAGCRNIREYNEKFAARKLNPEKGHQFLPFIVLVVDEFADLIMTAGKEVEMPIARLAQLARAVGVHLIIATQRPSVNIITGTIKANFPARIGFKVSSKIDSRTILDAGGAEQLIGKGDLLVSYNGELVRLQCAFVDTPEVDKIVEFIGEQRGYPQPFLLPEYVDEKELESRDFDASDKDPLFEDAAKLIVASQVGSTSLLQRRMKLGYNRAGRLMDQLEAAGIVGANQGSKARDVLIKTDADLQEFLNNMV